MLDLASALQLAFQQIIAFRLREIIHPKSRGRIARLPLKVAALR